MVNFQNLSVKFLRWEMKVSICENCHCNVNKLVVVSYHGKLVRVCVGCRRAIIKEQTYINDLHYR